MPAIRDNAGRLVCRRPKCTDAREDQNGGRYCRLHAQEKHEAEWAMQSFLAARAGSRNGPEWSALATWGVR